MKSEISHPKSEIETKRRQAALLPLVVALAIVAMVAYYIYWKQTLPKPPKVGDPAYLSMTDPAGAGAAIDGQEGPGGYQGGDDPGPFAALANPHDPAALLLRQPGDRVLTAEPAGLPAYPGGQRLSGMHRNAAGMVEELVHWRLPGQSVAQADEFYRNAALAVGFKAVVTNPPAPTTNAAEERINRIYVKADAQGHAAGMVLIVRAWPDSEKTDTTRAMLWLRYPSQIGQR